MHACMLAAPGLKASRLVTEPLEPWASLPLVPPLPVPQGGAAEYGNINMVMPPGLEERARFIPRLDRSEWMSGRGSSPAPAAALRCGLMLGLQRCLGPGLKTELGCSWGLG